MAVKCYWVKPKTEKPFTENGRSLPGLTGAQTATASDYLTESVSQMIGEWRQPLYHLIQAVTSRATLNIILSQEIGQEIAVKLEPNFAQSPTT